MGFLDFLRSVKGRAERSSAAVHAEAGVFADLSDPYLSEFLRGGSPTAAGEPVNAEVALRNPAMFRAVSVISYAIGMLPLHVRRNIPDGGKEKADDHPLYRLLHREPNDWQTAFDFRTLMQMRALIKGDAYALIVRSRDLATGKPKIVKLVPLDPDRMQVTQNPDWTLRYRYTPLSGGTITYASTDILHLRGMSLDGIHGLSIVRQAQEAIGLALAAEKAAARLFKHGVLLGGAFKLPPGSKISQPAYERLKADLANRYAGADNAHKWVILEEGWEMQQLSPSAADSQLIEGRRLQIEEIARVSGVPRPLLMMDETSWGSGIEALGRFFVQFALGPWFEAWQQAVERSLLMPEEKGLYEIAFNPGALLRGSMLDQATFFSKALGAGGSQGWMTANEVRELMDQNRHEGGDVLPAPAAAARQTDGGDGQGNGQEPGQGGTTRG